jgi:hypothetical protein
MSIAKAPSGRTSKSPPSLPLASPPAPDADEWSQPETTQVDARLEDRSDWARPADPNAKQAIEKMVEECLVDVPVRPIEDHRAAGSDANGVEFPGRPAAPPSRGRKMILAVAGLVAVAAAVWLAVQSNLVRF